MSYSRRKPLIPKRRKRALGIPYAIMGKGSRRVSGRDVRRENIAVTTAIADLLKTSLGPKGLDKMLLDKDGVIYVTNNGSIILDKIDVQHPIAKMLVEVAKAVSSEVGDGTVSIIILTGALLKNCEELLKKRLHPTILVEGYMKASEEAIKIFNENAITISPEDREILKHIAMTAMTGKLISEEKEHLAELVVKAILKIAEEAEGSLKVDLDNINLHKRLGGSLEETELIEGFAFFREIAHPNMPKRVVDAKILVVKGELRLEKRGKTQHYEHGFLLETPEKVRAFTNHVQETFRRFAEKIVNLGANVVVVEKGIAPTLLDQFARLNILAVRRVVIEDLERIAKTVGASVVSFIDDVSPNDLGEAQMVEERKLAGQPWLFIEGCARPKSLTILIRSEQDYALNEAERSITDALHAVRNVLKKPKIVVGGGAVEFETALRIKKWAESLGGREQLVVNKFGDALESIPLALAQNSGLNALDIQIDLRAHHSRGDTWFGVDVAGGKVANMADMKIFEPLLVKEQMIRSAVEIANTILRINDYIAGRKLEGSEFHEKKKEESTQPERVKKIHREYGVEGPYT